MFWGLIMEPGRCYTQKVKVSFHVSMAALDISNSSDEQAQVMCVFEGRNYLLCTLNNKDKVQCALDLNFEEGTKVSFATNGKAHVHLTGYLTNIEEDYFGNEVVLQKEEDLKKEKRIKGDVTEGPPNKKSKKNEDHVDVEEEEEDSSDSDFDMGNLIEGEDEEGSEEESEEEESGEEEEEDVEEDEDASSLSEEDIDETAEEKVKPKQNGVAKTKVEKKKNKDQKTQEKASNEKSKKSEKKEQSQKLKKTVLKGGVIAQDIHEGTGDVVKEGKFVHVYYEGRFKDNNKMFDCTTKGPGFRFRVGKGEVIKGWDIGLVGMRVGGRRRLTCPPKVAYGAGGSPPAIPPNATLVFDVEVKKVG